MLVKTDLRIRPTEMAQNISYQPTAPITADNVQDAIEQVAALAVSAPGYTPTVVTFAMSPYTPLITDTYLLVDTSAGAVSIQMPLSAARLGASGYVPLTVKDDTENASVNAISVLRAGAELIDGLTSYPLDSNSVAATFLPIAAGGYDVV